MASDTGRSFATDAASPVAAVRFERAWLGVDSIGRESTPRGPTGVERIAVGSRARFSPSGTGRWRDQP